MPPKSKFATDDIIDAAFRVARRDGMAKLTARTIADELNSSTMPIYSCGKTMAEIEAEVVIRAWSVLLTYQSKPRSFDPYLDMGLGYVMFARDERHLFKCIHSDKYEELNIRFAEKNVQVNIRNLDDYPLFVGVPDDIKLKSLIQGWVYAHGFADLLTRSLSTVVKGLETEEDIIAYFLEANMIYWEGLKHTLDESRKK